MGYLNVGTHTSLYVVEEDRVVNQIDLREGKLECFTAAWGLIVRKQLSLILCSEDGTWLGTVHLPMEPHESFQP